MKPRTARQLYLTKVSYISTIRICNTCADFEVPGGIPVPVRSAFLKHGFLAFKTLKTFFRFTITFEGALLVVLRRLTGTLTFENRLSTASSGALLSALPAMSDMVHGKTTYE